MTTDRKQKKILLIGPVTGTKGGVNVHLNRLASLLKDQYDLSYIDESRNRSGGIYNVRSGNVFRYLKLLWQCNIIHIHSNPWLLRCLHLVMGKLFNKRTVITIHSWDETKPNWQQQIVHACVKIADHVVVVGKEMERYCSYPRISIRHAFLPPVMEQEPVLPQQICLLFDGSKKKIIANAWKLFYHKGEELYGLDICVDLARMFRERNKPYKIIYVVAQENDILRQFMDTVSKEKLEPWLTIVPYPVSFVRLICMSDLVLRPTNKDGDSLTVREALFFNRPVIASDIVARPEGTVVFHNRDVADLFSKIEQVLDDVKQDSTVNMSNNGYVNFYQSLYEGSIKLCRACRP
jgi:glycosyltransferase involved in cell wall biosynthesis